GRGREVRTLAKFALRRAGVVLYGREQQAVEGVELYRHLKSVPDHARKSVKSTTSSIDLKKIHEGMANIISVPVSLQAYFEEPMLITNKRAARGSYPADLESLMNVERAEESRRWLYQWKEIAPAATP